MATPCHLSTSEQQQLQQWVAAQGTPQQVALRCRIVLAPAASPTSPLPGITRSTGKRSGCGASDLLHSDWPVCGRSLPDADASPPIGTARHKGTSHRIYKTPWSGDPRVNIQNSKGKAKDYQVKQVLLAIERIEYESKKH